MDLLAEIIILLQTNIPAILTVIVGVLAARFLLWRKFKRILLLISKLLIDLNLALVDDAFSIKECEKILDDIIEIIAEVYNKHNIPDQCNTYTIQCMNVYTVYTFI